MMRGHRGCGLENPFAKKWLFWIAWAVLTATVTPLVWAYGPVWLWLWLWLPLASGPVIWWEIRHRASKMYVTWWP